MESKLTTEKAAVSQNNELDKDVSRIPDPRSPLREIPRTPLQNENDGAKRYNITKNVDLRKIFENYEEEEKHVPKQPLMSAFLKYSLNFGEDTGKILHELEDNTCGSPCLNDPRFPYKGINRNPTVVAKMEDTLNARNVEELSDYELIKLMQNRYTERNKTNVSDKFSDVSIDSNNYYDSSVEEEQKSQDLVLPKKLYYDKFTDLAPNDTLKGTDESSTVSNEVNFEKVETEKGNSKEYIREIETVDECIQISENVKNIPLFQIIKGDPRSPSIGIERTPVVVAEKKGTLDDENVEETSEDSLVKVLLHIITVNRPSNVPDSEGFLIHEDESNSLNNTSKKSKSASSSRSRIPLLCKKNENKNDGTKNKGKQKEVSRIPRLESLVKQRNMARKQCLIEERN
ncbi:uncharacterized protein [Maniola hyperantus]|uniref:uncharacterized protein n=1 Tax=Aphantopus hyperantus TaxID=2795564 RepID=UPI00212AE6D8